MLKLTRYSLAAVLGLFLSMILVAVAVAQDSTVVVGGDATVLGMVWATVMTGIIANFSTEVNHWLAKFYNGAVAKVPLFLKGAVAVAVGSGLAFLNAKLQVNLVGSPGDWGVTGVQTLLGGIASFGWTLIQHKQAKAAALR